MKGIPDMIKVMNIITDTNIGGAGRLIIQCLKCFDRTKFDIVLVVPSQSALIPLIKNEGYRVIETEKGHDKSWEKGAVREYKKIIRAEKPDIVHTHSSFAGKLAAYLCGVKGRIYTRHCTFDMPRRLTTFPGKQINGLVNNTLATAIIAVAQSAVENLTETGVDPRKITVIANGVEPMRTLSVAERAEFRQSLGILPDEFVCLISARLEEYKGHSYLIDTAKYVRDMLGNEKKVRFIFMGDGTCRRGLEEKARDVGVDDIIIFTGFVDDVAPYCNIADLNLNCSWGTETASLALCEAMSLSLPSVVTDFGGNPYLITDGVNGLLVPKKDSASMADAIVRLIKDPVLLESLGKGAREEYEKKFTSQAMTEKLEALYEAQIKI